MTGKTDDVVVFLLKQDKGITWDLKEHKERRRLTQNAYYWVLVGKIAEKTGISSAEIHNRNLRDLGLVERMNGAVVPVYIPDTDEAERDALEAETFHIKPTSQTKEGKDGKTYRCYVLLRGSSTFNVAEFSALVDLIVQEALAQGGIEVLPPDELAHIRELERQHEERQKQKRLTPRPD